uniref:Uncharacterized protein n=1 Tax=Glossina palpalis gambiensis TaxID=67801 RepID=A0A1B0C761_9MUSC
MPNQFLGVPVLIFANKQDLPGAREPKELEKLLGLYELATPALQYTSLGKTSSSTGNVVSFNNSNTINRIPTTEIKSNFTSESSTQFNNMSLQGYENNINCSISRITRDLSITLPAISTSLSSSLEEASVLSGSSSMNREKALSAQNPSNLIFQSSASSLVTSPTSTIPTGGASAILLPQKLTLSAASTSVQLKNNSGCTSSVTQYKGWHIQPACAITGEGLQEGLEALYDMILKKLEYMAFSTMAQNVTLKTPFKISPISKLFENLRIALSQLIMFHKTTTIKNPNSGIRHHFTGKQNEK